MITLFLIDDKYKRFRFFKKTFLLADINIDIIFRLLFFTLSNVKTHFNNLKLKQKLYTIIKTFFIIKQVELVEKKEFVTKTLNSKDEIFVIYVAFFANCNDMIT